MIAPPGGTPAALTNLPGTGGALGAASSLAGYALGVLPGQAAIFTSQPLEDPLDLVGSSRIDLEITSVGELGNPVRVPLGPRSRHREHRSDGRTVTRAELGGAAATRRGPDQADRAHPGQPTRITVALPAVSHQVPVGHRLQLVVSTTDQAYAVPVRPAVYQIGLSR